MDNSEIFVFQSTYLTFKAERTLKSAGIPCKLVTKPRHISSDCGLAVRISTCKDAEVRTLMESSGIPFLGVW
jgi:hypothetical protein